MSRSHPLATPQVVPVFECTGLKLGVTGSHILILARRHVESVCGVRRVDTGVTRREWRGGLQQAVIVASTPSVVLVVTASKVLSCEPRNELAPHPRPGGAALGANHFRLTCHLPATALAGHNEVLGD